MDVCEPRVRRRGFFLHSTDGSEQETGEHENPEGVAVRVTGARVAVAVALLEFAQRLARSRPSLVVEPRALFLI